MKKIFTVFVLGAALSLGAAAQNWQDALLFTENNYSGSARGVAMGNALTAVGGDPGSIVFNPAGSAVAGYSQFTITPGLTLSASSSGASQILPSAAYTADNANASYVRAKLPNLSFIINMDTGRRRGLRRMSFGFVLNQSADFTGRILASGVNADNSYAASLASSAEGYSTSVLGGDWYAGGSAANRAAWVDMTGYQAYMFDPHEDFQNFYVAVTEDSEVVDKGGYMYLNRWLAGPLRQQYCQQTFGSKHEAILNFSMNYSDRFYIGANLGITALHYGMSEYWNEEPVNQSDFVIHYADGTSAMLESLRMNHTYSIEGSGIYLKAGALWRPFAGLRIGAAVQTPTVMNLREHYGYSGKVNMSGKKPSPASSPEDEWDYAVRNPWRFNAGVAYSIGSVALISADYELADYSRAIFASILDNGRYDYQDFYGESANWANDDIEELLGKSHQIRLGGEFRLTPEWSLRAGYNLTTSAEKNSSLMRRAVSLGFGHSAGSMYIDAAVRMRTVPSLDFRTYDYYTYDSPESFPYKYVDDSIKTPGVCVNTKYFDALVTIGWRF